MKEWFSNFRHRQGSFGLILLAIAAVAFGGSKGGGEIIAEEGIKLSSVSSDASGLKITWETTDERIVVGEDEFIILAQERQIPSRTGWSTWKEIGRTKDTTFESSSFFRNSDYRYKVYVDKGEVTK